MLQKENESVDVVNETVGSLFGNVKVIADSRVPNNEIWACQHGVVDQILDLDTNEVRSPDKPMILEGLNASN